MTDGNRVRVLVIIPTYEPAYLYHPQLEDFYTRNFDSYRCADGDVDVKLVVSDFSSSVSYKSFLKRYVASRNDCFLIDGRQEASVSIAFNLTLRNFDYDYAVYAASDTRVRDRSWLESLLNDFDDEHVHMVMTTTTEGGAISGQTQAGPINCESRVQKFPQFFNETCLVLSKQFLFQFDNKLPDLIDTDGVTYCIVHQLAAFGWVWKLNYRVNVIHDHLSGEHFAADDVISWRKRHGLFLIDQQKMSTRMLILPHPQSVIADSGGPIERLRKFIKHMRREGLLYFYFRLFGRRIVDNFRQLDEPTKLAILKALFFRPESDYDHYDYSIHGSPPADTARQSDDYQKVGSSEGG